MTLLGKSQIADSCSLQPGAFSPAVQDIGGHKRAVRVTTCYSRRLPALASWASGSRTGLVTHWWQEHPAGVRFHVCESQNGVLCSTQNLEICQ